MIAAYLYEREELALEAALLKFSTSRPHGIYKPDYVAELCARYDGEPDTEVRPVCYTTCSNCILVPVIITMHWVIESTTPISN